MDALLAAAVVRTLDDTDPSIAGDALYSEDEFLEWYVGQELGRMKEVRSRSAGVA